MLVALEKSAFGAAVFPSMGLTSPSKWVFLKREVPERVSVMDGAVGKLVPMSGTETPLESHALG